MLNNTLSRQGMISMLEQEIKALQEGQNGNDLPADIRVKIRNLNEEITKIRRKILDNPK